MRGVELPPGLPLHAYTLAREHKIIMIQLTHCEVEDVVGPASAAVGAGVTWEDLVLEGLHKHTFRGSL